jgi:hypoxanthine phosphoribosyltransferase
MSREGQKKLSDAVNTVEVMISQAQLSARVQELGAQISQAYQRKDPVLISILKGAVVFLADLIRALTIPLTIDFMAISSYSETGTSGVVRIVKDLEQDIAGRHVLIVEDIVDTGLTLGYLLRILQARNPLSLQICTLLDRSVRRIVDLPVAFRGFEIPDCFVVGYGLDYQQRYRNLPYIGILKPPG